MVFFYFFFILFFFFYFKIKFIKKKNRTKKYAMWVMSDGFGKKWSIKFIFWKKKKYINKKKNNKIFI